MQDNDDNVKVVDFTDKNKTDAEPEPENYAMKMHKEAAAKRASKQAEMRKQNNINTKRNYGLTRK